MRKLKNSELDRLSVEDFKTAEKNTFNCDIGQHKKS